MTDVANVNERFRQEAESFNLQYKCEHCDHWSRLTSLCSIGWPNGMLVGPPVRALDGNGAFVFCKYFEMEGV